MAAGRPTKYTLKLSDDICAQLSEGKSLRGVCRDESMPCAATVFSWLRTKPEFLEQYDKAKAESADALVDEMLDIVDHQACEPLMVDGKPILDSKGDPVKVTSSVAIQHARLRYDARKWTASKLKPKKYGDKVELSNDPENPIPPQLVFVPRGTT